MDVGSPGTSATSSTEAWVVLEEGCSLANPNLTDCWDLRGQTFSRNESSSWSTNRLANGGLFELLMISEAALGLEGNAYFGFDTISFNTSSGKSVEMASQLVAGYATNDFWLGFFPLSPIAMNITDMVESIPSLLASLADQDRIPSRSWAYTAGAYYRDPPALASLTLGGYDELKIGERSLQVPFGTDQSRDLVVWLESISYDTYGGKALLTQGVYMFIDSLVPHLWLPLDVCQRFEQAFNLTWDNETELYLLDDAVHTALVEQNPEFTLLLSESEDRNELITIKIPYAAFDLNVSAPLVNSTSRYFPLKRAANDSQPVLGRVFLQEAYIIADYDRRNFSISQAAFLQDSNASQIIDIASPSIVPNSTDDASNASGAVFSGNSLSAGAIAGIVLGAVSLPALATMLYLWLRKRKTRKTQAVGSDVRKTDVDSPEERNKDDDFMPEMAVNGHTVHEAGCGFGAVPELQDSADHVGRHELSALGIIPEVEGRAVCELASDQDSSG
ncbi:hypothetical protein PRZ48_007394 [Zasmidium cellare]|uniref:Peptidase A1 domain-containing protein n=1 Tax=Zasmidium cellare TaxID=395010 RepID=A0ABR0EK78_ZASCE|nr:hypothetical protein PRZ48_007394 [Zasmidium cellare]